MLPPLHMPQLPPLQHYSSSLAAGPELRAPAAGYEIFRCLVIFFRRVSAICILFFGANHFTNYDNADVVAELFLYGLICCVLWEQTRQVFYLECILCLLY